MQDCWWTKWYWSIVFTAFLQFYSLLHIYIRLFYEMCDSPVYAAFHQIFSFYSGILSLWQAAGYSQNLEEFLSTHANWKHYNEVNVFGLHCCHQSTHNAQHTARSKLTQHPWSTLHRWVLFEVMECALHISHYLLSLLYETVLPCMIAYAKLALILFQ